MKRKILFRGFCPSKNGKQIITLYGEDIRGDWVYGDLIQNIDCVKVRERETDINRIAKSYVVIPETVGQFTGLTDKNGKKIFEHDKVIYGERIDYDLWKESIANPEEYDGIIYDKEIIETDINHLKDENERLTKQLENSVQLPIRFDMGKGECLIAWRKRSNTIEITFNKLAEKGVVGRRYHEYPKCDFTEMIVLSLGDEIAFRKFFQALKILKAEAEPFACTEARLKELQKENKND